MTLIVLARGPYQAAPGAVSSTVAAGRDQVRGGPDLVQQVSAADPFGVRSPCHILGNRGAEP